jgi:hypothetical protein
MRLFAPRLRPDGRDMREATVAEEKAENTMLAKVSPAKSDHTMRRVRDVDVPTDPAVLTGRPPHPPPQG